MPIFDITETGPQHLEGGLEELQLPFQTNLKVRKVLKRSIINAFLCFLVCCELTFKASESLKFLIVLCDTIFCQSKLYIYWCKFSSKNVSVISTPLVGKMMLQLCETIFDNLDHRITTQKMKFPFKDFFSKCDQIR